MSDSSVKITYWAATGLVALVYLGGATFYIAAHDMVAGIYEGQLHFPTYIIWPPAIVAWIALIVSFLTQNRGRTTKSPYADLLNSTA